jgi:hypothetical protein
MFDEKRNQQKLFFDFSFSQSMITQSRKKTTKIVFRFFFFFERVTSESDIIKRMKNDNDDDNIVNCEFESNASSIRSESYSSSVILIQFLLIDSLLVDISLTRFISRSFIVNLTTRRTSFKLKSRRAQRRILFNSWTNWLRANSFSFDSHNILIRRNFFS